MVYFRLIASHLYLTDLIGIFFSSLYMIWDGFSMKEYLIFSKPFHNLSIGFFTTGTNHAMIAIDVTGRQRLACITTQESLGG